MRTVKLQIPEYLYAFYAKVGLSAGRTPRQVMADILFRAAGELSAEALGIPLPEDDG